MKNKYPVCSASGIRKGLADTKAQAIAQADSIGNGAYVIIERKPLADSQVVYFSATKTRKAINLKNN